MRGMGVGYVATGWIEGSPRRYVCMCISGLAGMSAAWLLGVVVSSAVYGVRGA